MLPVVAGVRTPILSRINHRCTEGPRCSLIANNSLPTDVVHHRFILLELDLNQGFL